MATSVSETKKTTEAFALPALPPKRYEYKNAKVGGSLEAINEYGAQGWRVIRNEMGWALLEREY